MSAARKPRIVFCCLPTGMPADEAAAWQELRRVHCADGRDHHHCLGQVTIDRAGITLSCPRCGDARSLYPAADG